MFSGIRGSYRCAVLQYWISLATTRKLMHQNRPSLKTKNIVVQNGILRSVFIQPCNDKRVLWVRSDTNLLFFCPGNWNGSTSKFSMYLCAETLCQVVTQGHTEKYLFLKTFLNTIFFFWLCCPRFHPLLS